MTDLATGATAIVGFDPFDPAFRATRTRTMPVTLRA